MLDLKLFDELVNTKNRNIYLKINGKIRCDAETYSYEEAEELDTIAWWVSDDYVVIDVDIKAHANILFKIIKAKKINCHIFRSIKGAHFVFKENPNHEVPQVVANYAACGIKFDTRTTGKGYIVLPHKQDNRKWVKLTKGKLDELPMWLFPQKILTTKYKDSIVTEETGKKKKIDIMPAWTDMGEGDGRNEELFRYFTTLLKLKCNLTLADKRQSVEVLNDFVLYESLPDAELHATVLRKEITENLEENSTDHGTELDPDIIANKIIADEDIITKHGHMFIYRDGYYNPINEEELHYLIHHKYDKRAKDFKRNEIVKFIRVKTDIRDEEVNRDPMMINCINTRVNLQTMEQEEHIETSYDTIRIPHKYNLDAKKPSPVLDKFLRFISDSNKDKLTLIFEMIGLCLVKKEIMEKFFVLLGEKGANGKSTLLEIIENLLGSENVANIDLGELGSDEYAAYELYSKLANIGDDLKGVALKETGLIKTMTSGKWLSAKVKFKPRFKFRNFATMVYAANSIPITYDKSGGLYRRFVIISFNNSVPAGERDPFLVDKLTESDYQYLLRRAVKAVAKVIGRNQLTQLAESEKLLKQYKEKNSSVLIFLQENAIDSESIDHYPVKELFADYKDFCIEGSYKTLQKQIFDGEIRKQFGVEKRTTTKNSKANISRWVYENE